MIGVSYAGQPPAYIDTLWKQHNRPNYPGLSTEHVAKMAYVKSDGNTTGVFDTTPFDIGNIITIEVWHAVPSMDVVFGGV